MKFKVLVAAMLLPLLAMAVAKADTRAGPKGITGQQMETWDYGGVDYSTVTFSSASVLAMPDDGIVVGVIASSPTGNLGDFVAFYDTAALNPGFINGTSAYVTSPEVFRVYLSSVNTTIGTGGGQSFRYGTVVALPAPIRFLKGCVWSVSTNAYNIVTVLYHRFHQTAEK